MIEDHAVRNGEPAVRETLLRLVLALAHSRGFSRAGGWLPAAPPADGLFTITPRLEEITMVKSLDLNLSLDPATLAAADWWQEIDHV